MRSWHGALNVRRVLAVLPGRVLNFNPSVLPKEELKLLDEMGARSETSGVDVPKLIGVVASVSEENRSLRTVAEGQQSELDQLRGVVTERDDLVKKLGSSQEDNSKLQAEVKRLTAE